MGPFGSREKRRGGGRKWSLTKYTPAKECRPSRRAKKGGGGGGAPLPSLDWWGRKLLLLLPPQPKKRRRAHHIKAVVVELPHKGKGRLPSGEGGKEVEGRPMLLLRYAWENRIKGKGPHLFETVRYERGRMNSPTPNVGESRGERGETPPLTLCK